jgi:hypothetical protein
VELPQLWLPSLQDGLRCGNQTMIEHFELAASAPFDSSLHPVDRLQA